MCGVTRVLLLHFAIIILNIIKILFFIHVRMSVCNFVYSRDLGAQLWTIFDDEL